MNELSAKYRIFMLLEDSSLGNPLARLVDKIIVVLILINVCAVITATVPDLPRSVTLALEAIEMATVAMFIFEYVLRLWVSDLHLTLRRHGPIRARLLYVVQPVAIVDLLAILPAATAIFWPGIPIASLVVLRLLRFLKLARYSPGVVSLFNAIKAERRALIASGVIIAGLIIASASLMHAVEGDVQPEAFGSVPAALYWAAATVTTVGYGDIVPLTPVGKSVAGLTMVLGFLLFALPIGIIATAFAREIHQRDFVVNWGMLARVPLFADLDAADIAAIMPLLRAQTVDEGTVITYADEEAHSMYFIASGTVEVDLPGQKIRLSDGDFFGEVAVLRKSKRSADVIAMTACRLLVLDASDLQYLMHKRPDIGRHIKATADARLSRQNVTPKGDITREEIAQAPDDGKADTSS